MEPREIVALLIQVSTMLVVFAIGLQSRWSDLGYALARPRLLLRGFVAVYVAVPVTAFVAALLLPIEPAVKIGIVAMGLSPLTPLVPGKMLKAGADTSYVIGVYVGLLMLATVMVPATLVIVTAITGGTARIGVGAITWLVVSSILLPLVTGIFVATLAPAVAPLISRAAAITGFVAVLIVMALILIMAGGRIVAAMGNGTVLAIVLAVLAGLAAGHLLGGPALAQRSALAQAAASRHPGIAALMVQQNFESQPAILAAVLLYLLVGTLVCALYVRWVGKRPPRAAAPSRA